MYVKVMPGIYLTDFATVNTVNRGKKNASPTMFGASYETNALLAGLHDAYLLSKRRNIDLESLGVSIELDRQLGISRTCLIDSDTCIAEGPNQISSIIQHEIYHNLLPPSIAETFMKMGIGWGRRTKIPSSLIARMGYKHREVPEEIAASLAQCDLGIKCSTFRQFKSYITHVLEAHYPDLTVLIHILLKYYNRDIYKIYRDVKFLHPKRVRQYMNKYGMFVNPEYQDLIDYSLGRTVGLSCR